MSNVDNRIVNMQFNNAQFQQGASATISTLDKLKQSLMFPGATKGLDDISAAASRTNSNLGPLEGGVTRVSSGFLAMTTVALTALASITTKAIAAGTQIVKSLTIAPVAEGFNDYNEKLTSVQTIMNATGASIQVVDGYFKELDTYADKTVYNLQDMTGAFAKFTNAGVDMDKSVPAIKGIANMVALAGQGANAASIAMYNLSQSIAGGFLTTTDYKSLNLANVATKEWKEQMIQGAVAAGTLKKAADGTYTIASSKSKKAYTDAALFNEALSEGWATADVLTTVLGDFGDTTTAIGKKAQAAAQNVKSLPMMMETLKAAVGTGWTDSFELILGNVTESTELFTGLTYTIGGFLDASSKARNDILKEWKDLGGRDTLIQGFKDGFRALGEVLAPIKEAFREIFPPATGKALADLTKRFADFTSKLRVSSETAANIKSTFKGAFAIFSIISQIIKGAIGVIGDLIGQVTKGSGGFLAFTAKIGDFISGIDKAIKSGTGLTTFFKTLSSVLQAPIKILQAIAGFIGSIFGGFDTGKADDIEESFGRISDRLSPLEALIKKIGEAFSGLSGMFDRLTQSANPLIQTISNALSGIWDALKNAFSTGNFNTVLDTVNTALFGGLVLIIKKFLGGGLKDALSGGIFGSSGEGMFSSIKDSFDALSGSLQAMQQNIKANVLLKIAGAVALLTVSIVALSLIDSAKLTKALTAIAVGFAELLAAMKILEYIGSSAGFIKIPVIATSMILLSTAILILTAAVKNLSSLSWGELAKGLSGIAGLLLILSAAVKPLSANAAGMIRAGAGILVLSVALKVLASAVKDFGSMDWGTIGKGLLGVAGALVVISGAMRLMPTNMILQAAALVLIGTSLKVLASAISDFGSMDWGSIGKGLIGIGGALVVISAAMWTMPSNMIVTAAGLVILSVALSGIGKVIKNMGGMSWGEIAKGLVTLGAALAIIAGGLYLMTGTIAGSAALLIAAGALAIFVPILATLGSLSWGNIFKGLATLAGLFLVVGLAGLALAPIVPVIALLGVSLLTMGAALALAGAGTLAFATALTMLVAVGAAAAAVVGSMLSTIIGAIPKAMKAFAEGIVQFASTIAKGGPSFVLAFTTIMTSILTTIRNVTPQIAQTFVTLVRTLLKVLVDSVPKMAAAGMKIINGVLKAIGDNIYKTVTLGANIIVKFLKGIGDNLPKIITEGARVVTKFIKGIGDNLPDVIDEGVKTVIKFVNGIADGIRNNKDEMNKAGKNLAGAIVDGLVSGIGSGITAVTDAARNLAKKALEAAKRFLGIDSPSKAFNEVGVWSGKGMALGLDDSGKLVADSAENVADTALTTMKKTMAQVSDIISSDINVVPVVAPVIDLTQFKRDAGKLQTTINATSLVAPVSVGRAYDISSEREAARLVDIGVTKEKEVTPIKFEQNNYSPKALSTIEIYRNTKSQLALAKEALAT